MDNLSFCIYSAGSVLLFIQSQYLISVTKIEISFLSTLNVTLLRLNHHGFTSRKADFRWNWRDTSLLTKVEIQSSLKGYTEEKLAQAIASRLEGPAFDVYLRMSSEDRKDASKIKAELLKEFERGKRNREEALDQLGKVRGRKVSLHKTMPINSKNL